MRRAFLVLWNLTFSTRWIILINLVLATIVGYNGMKVILSFLSRSVPYLPSSHYPLSENPPTVIPSSPHISSLTETYLFGVPQEQKKASVPPASPLATPLNLKLQGIYHSSFSKASYAVIMISNEKSVRYKIGDTLTGGATLYEIEPKKVVLMRNNRKEVLYLEGTKTSSSASLDKQSDSPSTPRVEQLLGDYQRQLQGDPMRLMKLMRVHPVTQGGNFIGYRLSPDPSFTSQFKSQFNLQMGDIITAINGVKLDSPLKGLGIIEQLATADHLDLSVLRDGQTISLSFAIEK